MKFRINDKRWYSVNDDLCFEDFFTYKTIHTNKQITYYQDILAFDIETSSFDEFDEEALLETKDTEVYNHLKGTTIRISQKFYSDIPDFNDIRRSLFGRIWFSKTEGISVDSLYHELSETYPYYFPDDIWNTSDMLEQIVTVFLENSPEREDQDTKRSIMYVWQLAINGTVIIGRTWDEFLQLMDQIREHFDLGEHKRMLIFVHNLSFEMQFIKNLFTWSKVFAIAARKPIYGLTESGFEFRCSYILSGLSLANLARSLHKYQLTKMVGELDYDLVRHSETPLTGEDSRMIDPHSEIGYCCYDVLVLSAWLAETIEHDGDITKLCLTATGYCRNYMRKICLGHKDNAQYNKFHNLMLQETISGPEEFDQFRRAFQGGYTHPSARNAFKTLHGVSSRDLCSAYPASMLLWPEYPVSKFKVVQIHDMKEFNMYIDLYACIFDIKFIDIKPKFINDNYIATSKCWKNGMSNDKWLKEYNVITNNGRLVSADEITISITNLDFRLIEKTYTYKSIAIGTFRVARKGYLPVEYARGILHLYKNKTELKGIKGLEDFLQKQKGLLNACYGMICTNILMDIHKYENDSGWTVEHPDAEKTIKKYNKSKKRFLFYPQACFVTAIVRCLCLWPAILACGDRFIYSDTDSVKYIGNKDDVPFFDDYNKMIDKLITLSAEHYDIPEEYYRPKTIEGKVKPIGYFEFEETYYRFKTIGAKRYLVETEDHELIMTVSGVNKKIGSKYMLEKYGLDGAFESFDIGLTIPAAETGKLTHYYLDDTMEGEVTDYLGNTIHYRSESGIYLEKAEYSFSDTSGYLDYVKTVQGVYI